MRKLITIISIMLIATTGMAQSSALDMSKASIVWKKDFATTGLSYFKFLYPSVNTKNDEVILSGLVAFPNYISTETSKRILPQNIIIGCHITITDNQSCPSNFNWGLDDVSLLISYAAGSNDTLNVVRNNLLVIPDYLGYGETVGFTHPYLCEKLTARNIIDGARYGKALMQTLTYEDNKITKTFDLSGNDWRTIALGYSQGGASAMATHRYIEQNDLSDEFHFLGSVCGAGPYSPLTTVKECINTGELSMPVVAALVVNGLIVGEPSMHSHTASEYLTSRFLDTGIMQWITDKKMSTTRIQDSLDAKGFTTHSVNDIFRNDFIESVRTGSGNQAYRDILQAMNANDMTSGWTSRHRICIFHSNSDNVVPIENAYNYLNNNYNGKDGLAKPMISDYGAHIPAGLSFYFSFWSSSYSEQLVKWLYSDDATWGSVGSDYVPTSIESVINTTKSMTDNAIYDLRGCRMNPSSLPHGVFIRNGHKFVVQ